MGDADDLEDDAERTPRLHWGLLVTAQHSLYIVVVAVVYVCVCLCVRVSVCGVFVGVVILVIRVKH